MSKGVMTYLPSHDGHPGMELTWAADCREVLRALPKMLLTRPSCLSSNLTNPPVAKSMRPRCAASDNMANCY